MLEKHVALHTLPKERENPGDKSQEDNTQKPYALFSYIFETLHSL